MSEPVKATSAFKVTLPRAAAKLVRKRYSRAASVLEYGSGRSTVLAAKLKVPHLSAVESDATWAGRLQTGIEEDFPGQACVVRPVDIGPTRSWGKPVNAAGHARYHLCATEIWDRADFVAPDVVLIDGRFRVACFLTVLMRTQKPVTVLFDDYGDRNYYRWIEEFAVPVGRAGRMAEFVIEPGARAFRDWSRIIEAFVDVR